MTTRSEALQPARDRGDVVRPRGGQQPRHWAPRGLTAGIALGDPKSPRELAGLTEQALKRMGTNVDAELRRIGRFIDRDGYYKDGIVTNTKGEVIVPTATGGVSTVLDKDTTETEIVSSSSLTTIYNGIIPADSMGVDGLVELIMYSDYLNNSGSNRGLQFQVILNGTTYYDYSTITTFFGQQAARRVNTMCVYLSNLGSKSSNLLRFEFTQTPISSLTSGTVTTGVGGFFSTSPSRIGFLGGSLPITENTGSDTTLTVKVAHSASHASLSFRQLYSVLRRTA